MGYENVRLIMNRTLDESHGHIPDTTMGVAERAWLIDKDGKLGGRQRVEMEEWGRFFTPTFLQPLLVTLLPLFLTRVVSSDTTRSTHFRLGSFSLRICFFTIVSKARSGVNNPVLRGQGDASGQGKKKC